MKTLRISLSVLVIALALTAVNTFAQINATIALSGTILDELTREPVTVSLIFYDESGMKANSTRSNEKEGGNYYVILKPGQRYKVEFDHPNYFREERIVETPKATKYVEISRDFVVKPMREGAHLALSVSPFEYKKSKLRVGSDDVLNTLRDALVKNPNVHFEIQCFPDLNESKEANAKLTQERTAALKEYFAKGGVSADRISVKASGEIDPFNPLPIRKGAKGKRYVGSSYIVITKV